MVRKTKEDTERTYHALLDAATLLFMRQGIAKTTLNDIASEAGMTRGAIYWHFDNKDAVIKGIWQRNASTIHANFTQELKNLNQEDSADQFRNIIKQLVKQIAGTPELGQAMRIVMLSVEFTDEQTELQAFLVARRQEVYDNMEQAFKKLKKHNVLVSLLPPKIIAQSLMSYLCGLINVYFEPGQDRMDLKKNGDQLLDLWLDAVLVPTAD